MRTAALLSLSLFAAACGGGTRPDGARPVPIDLGGSHQNPCWSPDGARLVFTRFAGAYNDGEAVVAVVDARGGAARVLSAAGGQSVDLPGCYSSALGAVAYSSDVETGADAIYLVAEDGAPRRVPGLPAGQAAFEPTVSPDGAWIVYEAHDAAAGAASPGAIWKLRVDGSEAVALTSAADGDAKEPNWSPAGDRILFQSRRSGSWDIWTIDPDGTSPARITTSDADDTDASWSPDGAWIVYSSNDGGLSNANVFAVPAAGGAPVRVTRSDGYDGAPAWSPDGATIAFESSPAGPDGSPGTHLWIIDLPAALKAR